MAANKALKDKRAKERREKMLATAPTRAAQGRPSRGKASDQSRVEEGLPITSGNKVGAMPVRARSSGTGMEGSPETVKVTKGKTPDKPSSKPPPSKRKTTDPKTAKVVSKNVPMPPRRAPKTETPKPTGRESSPENASKKKYAKAGTGIFDRLDRALGGKGKADYTYDMPGDKYAKGGMVKRMKDSTTANGKMAKPARLKKATKKQTMACGGAVKKR